MKTRIQKVYQKWCVEFPFSCTVYCDSFHRAMEVAHEFDRYLLSTEAV